MSGEEPADEVGAVGAASPEGVQPPPVRRRVRRRPEQTSDDTDRGWGERAEDDEHERWLREQRPPHWD